jgi:hypothetical protein
MKKRRAEQPGLFDPVKQKQAAKLSVAANAASEAQWMFAAREAIHSLIAAGKPFTVDDIYAALPNDGGTVRPMGLVIAGFVQAGAIRRGASVQVEHGYLPQYHVIGGKNG